VVGVASRGFERDNSIILTCLSCKIAGCQI
jgi:hypothetical protein